MTTPLTPETLVYGFTTAGEPRIAPDGARILFTKSKADAATGTVGSQVWSCDIHGGDMRQLTRGGERNGGARWSPDGAQIAFVSDRVKRAGIFVMPADGLGEAREVTRHNQGIGDLAWSPDGQQIAYTTTWDPANPDEDDPAEGAAPKVRVTSRIDYKQDTRGYLGDVRLHVWVVDVASGARRRLSSDLRDHVTPQWSPDGAWLGATQQWLNGMAGQLVLLPLDGGERRVVGAGTGSVGPWSWSPDGARVIVAADPDGTPQLDFYVHDLAGGQTTRLTDDLQVSPTAGNLMDSAPGAPVWLDERQVLFPAAHKGASGLHVIDSVAGAVEPVAGFVALHAGLSVDAARRYAVQTCHSAERVGEISVYDLTANTQTIITDFSGPVLAESPSAKPEKLSVTRGDFEIEAWLLHPPDFDPAKSYPLVIDIHGGPHGFYGEGFYPWQQALATNGFLVVYANPRGSGSYGRKFGMAVRHDWGGEDYLDLLAVVDKVLERPYADAARTGMRGYSYGGYMTSWILGHTNRFKACVCGAPCFDFESFWGTSDIGHSFGEMQFGDAPHKAKAEYAKHSPSEFIHNAITPTLIIHGEADQRCPIGQGEQLFISLLRAGVETEFVRYPGADHLFLLYGPPAHRADFWRRELAWFTKHLKPEATA